MFKSFSALLCAALLGLAAPAFADTVSLRPRIEANGAAITLGDVFDGAGAEAGRAIAPAPPPGQIARLSPQFLAAAAQSAGHSWTPPSGVREIQVVRPGGARATLAPRGGETQSAAAELAVRRGETVMLVFSAPGMQLTSRARAMQDGAVGEPIRLLNLQSNRTIDAIVTGPGAATVSN